MKKTIRKLTLNRETLRRLDADSLRWAAGGRTEGGAVPECPAQTHTGGGTGGGGGSGQCGGDPTWPSCDACGPSAQWGC